MIVFLPACLPPILPACVHVFFSFLVAFLSICHPTFLRSVLRVYLPSVQPVAYLSTYHHTFLRYFMCVYLPLSFVLACLPVNMSSCLPSIIPAYVSVCLPSFMLVIQLACLPVWLPSPSFMVVVLPSYLMGVRYYKQS